MYITMYELVVIITFQVSIVLFLTYRTAFSKYLFPWLYSVLIGDVLGLVVVRLAGG